MDGHGRLGRNSRLDGCYPRRSAFLSRIPDNHGELNGNPKRSHRSGIRRSGGLSQPNGRGSRQRRGRSRGRRFRSRRRNGFGLRRFERRNRLYRFERHPPCRQHRRFDTFGGRKRYRGRSSLRRNLGPDTQAPYRRIVFLHTDLRPLGRSSRNVGPNREDFQRHRRRSVRFHRKRRGNARGRHRLPR